MNVFDVPSDPAFWQAPYPFYAEALRSGDGLFAFSSGGYSVLSYDALYEIGRDPRAQGHPFPEGGLGPELDNLYRLLRWGLFALGSPHHRPLRMAAISGLSTLKPELVRAISRDVADQLAQRIFARGGGDLLADITLPLAARVSCRLSGIPKSEAPHVVSHIEVITHQLNGVPVAPADADHAARELYALLERSASGGQSALVDAVAAKLPPGSPATAVDIVASFMFDAVEMVSAGLFSALDCLGDQPGLTERVRSGEWDLGAAVQEAFRLTTPATLTSRIAEEAIEWQGNIIEKGAPLMMWWAAGNLDERMFPDPTRFDPNRRPNRHLAFGIGGHACIGRQIASIVAEEAVSTFLMHPAHRIQQNTRPVFLPRLTRMVEVAPITVI